MWICYFIGVWISLAPLVFWAPTAVAYLNGTLVGALVIALSILIPGMPNMIIYLVISQPVVVGEWCTFCLLAAAIMLPMISLAVDEVIAMMQHMIQAKKRGDNLWRVFWKGGEPFEQNQDERSPKLMELPQKPGQGFMTSIWGMSFPWTLVVSTLLGAVLMFGPATFGVSIEATAANIFHLGCSLIIVFSVMSMGEPIRIGRYMNVLLGLVVAVGPWVVQDSTFAMSITGAVIGLTVAVLAIPRGPKTETYGNWDKYVK